MNAYQVQVMFRGPYGPKDRAWVPVARASSQDGAREYAAMWQRSSDKAKNIAGIRIMKDGKEIEL